MRENEMNPTVIRAGKANMFYSPVFTESFVNATGVPVELYASDGSVGAAIGAGIGAKAFANEQDAFSKMKPLQLVEPDKQQEYDSLYQEWKKVLEMHLSEP
jgi:xylulokinase